MASEDVETEHHGEHEHGPLCGYDGVVSLVNHRVRMLPPDARQALLDMLLSSYCPWCGFELHPNQEGCPCPKPGSH